jgi:DNA-binding GntR family transcriptional regulator
LRQGWDELADESQVAWMTGKLASKFAPLRYEPAPLRNQIIASLRSAIEAGLLQPGERLIERDLCEQLGVSRTSLREALRELQALGVLAQTDNRGLVVGTLSAGEAANVYSIRAVLEALVVGEFVERASDEQIEELRGYGNTLKQAYRSGSVEHILRAKRAFYDCICSGAQNALAFDIINRLTLRTAMLRSRSLARKLRQKESVKEIEAILATIEARDAEAAKHAAATHVLHASHSALHMPSVDAPEKLARLRRVGSKGG